MKKLILGFIFLVSLVVTVSAVPAAPYMVARTQPDGSVVNVFLRGDEYFSYLVSEDGYLLAEADNGYIEYAGLSAVGCQIKPAGVKATRIADRSAAEKQYLRTAVTEAGLKQRLAGYRAAVKAQAMAHAGAAGVAPKAYPLQGSPKSLVILANYKDIKFTSSTAQQDYTRLLNEEGYSDFGGNGSARDYFRESSMGQFTPEFVVVGPVELPENHDYYGARVGESNDRNACQMIVDACRAADGIVNFKEFDTDNDGRLDNVFVYYAGYNEAEGGGSNPNTIWPHRSTVWCTSLVLDGVRIVDYACTSEFRGRSGGVRCGIGTFCHEFGHVLSLPDFYDTDYTEGNTPTLGSWDIMDQGSYNNNGCNPPVYSSFERFSLGWLTPEILKEDGTYSLEPIVTSNSAYLLSSLPARTHNLNPTDPNPKEFWMIENRRQIGMDIGAPAEGLLVTHIVYDAGKWNQNRPNNTVGEHGVEIVCAAGTTGNPSQNVFPGSRDVTTCEFQLRDGSKLESPLLQITEMGNISSFFFGNDPDAPKLRVDGNFNEFQAYFGETKPVQVVTVAGSNLKESVSLIFYESSRSQYRMRRYTDDGSESYATSMYLSPDADGMLNERIEVMFDPKSVQYDKPVNDKFLVRSGSIRLEYALSGLSQEPYRIFAPEAYEAADVTPYSFKASWQKVDPAYGYRLSVYSISEQRSSEVEEFSDFDNRPSAGWNANFKTVQTSYTKSAPKAAFFTSSADTLWSKEYFMPVSEISFWIHCVNSNGTLRVDAMAADGQWVNVHEEGCGTTTRSKTVRVPFESALYTRFRAYYTTGSATGGLSFDDFTAYFDKTISYVLNDEFVPAPDTVCNVSKGLRASTGYRYVVKAVQSDDAKNYEYLSEPSNEISVTTLEGEDENSRNISVIRDNDGTYKVYVPDVQDGYSLFIYTVDGRKVLEIPAESSEFVIPRLTNNTLYILKYAENGRQKRKTKVGKLLYIE